METIQSQTGYVEVNGTRLAYEIAGTGQPLILIHGGLVDKRSWDAQFGEFARYYRVIRYDLRGYGLSATLPAETPAYAPHEDLYALMQALGIEKASLLGLSMGGGLAVDFALEHPASVSSLVLAAMSLGGVEGSAQSQAMWKAFGQALNAGQVNLAVELTLRHFTDGLTRTPEQVNPAARSRVRELGVFNFSRPDPGRPEMISLNPPASERLAEIQVPTLIIVGDQDAEEVHTAARLLKAHVANAREVVIPDTAHHLNLEQPEIFNRVVLEFLEPLHG